MARRNFFESNNPMFKEENYKSSNTNTVLDADLVQGESVSQEPMTVSGAVNKTLMMMGVMIMSASFAFMYPSRMLGIIAFIGVMAISFIASRNIEKSHIWGPLQGIFLGFSAGIATAVYGGSSGLIGGVVSQAVLLTLSIMFTMLMLYKTGTIKVTEKLRSMVSVAVGAVMITYMVEFVLHMFGVDIPFLHDASPIGIGISLVIIGIASFNLLLDFDNFYKGEAMRAPAYMEWYFGMGLMFTLVWLYIEIIRIVAYFSGGD